MTGTLTGKFMQIDSVTPAKGTVVIEANVPVIVNATGKVLFSGPLRVDLVGGAFSVAVPASDDPSLNPREFSFTVTPNLSHALVAPIKNLRVPSASTVDVTAEVDPNPAAPNYAQKVNEATGAATNASASATSATASKDAAAVSAAAAKTSETNAAASAANAATSAADAAAQLTVVNNAGTAKVAEVNAAGDAEIANIQSTNLTVTTTTGAPGTQAQSVTTGTFPNLSLALTIPRGDQGAQGAQGLQGVQGLKGDKGDPGSPTPVDYEGSGFPEGVVTATVGKTYRDNAGTNGAILWVKASGTGNTGWKVVYGDTGWRDQNGHWEPTKLGANYATYQVRLSTENGFEVRMKAANTAVYALVAGNYKGWIVDLNTSAAMFSTASHTGFPLGTGVFGRPTVTDTLCTLFADKKVYLAANCYLDHSQQIYLTARPPATWPTTLPGTPA